MLRESKRTLPGNQKVRKAKSGATLESCCFYNKQHVMLGVDPTSLLPTAVDFSQQPDMETPAAHSEEEEVG